MSDGDLDRLMKSAQGRLQAGRLSDAERACRQVISVFPDHPDALHMLGVLAGQAGRVDVALNYVRRAIGVSPGAVAYHNTLGRLLATHGRLDEAGASFARAIQLAPTQPEAHNNLGIVLRERKQWDQAIASFQWAIAIWAEYAEAHYNLGNTLRDAGRFEDAVAAYRRAIAVRPAMVEAYNNLSNVLSDLKRYDEAIDVCRTAIQLKPDFAKAHNNLGGALREKERLPEALVSIEKALQIDPAYTLAHTNRGIVLHQLNRPEDAIAAFIAAIRLSPRSAEAFNHLGNTLKDAGRIEEATAALRRAIELRPDYAEAFCSLGNLYQETGDVDRAGECCQRAISLKPDLAEAHNVLGNVMRDQGRLDEALSCYRRAIDLKPESPAIHSNLVYAVYFHGDYDSARILAENRQWAQRHEAPLSAAARPPHGNERSPNRRLKIGYVSPDFRRHPAASFMLPLLRAHDAKEVEVFCYSSVKNPDAITAQCRQLAHVWREVRALSHAELADRIRQDQIDILVDLTLHMAQGRLLTFARKPAPVQVTWLGYPGTTGLSAIDYRLSDPHLDPPGVGDEFYSEKTVRLPSTFWCYQPLVETPPVAPLPALKTGRMTFACFNHFAKVTSSTLALWERTLGAVEGSRMILLAPEGSPRRRVSAAFEAMGISAGRIEFVSRLAPEVYFQIFHRVDLCLDPIPYPGHTSTLDSLWMGAPAVTLCGQTAAARGGASLLRNLKLPQFIAATPEDYVRIARETAENLPGLAALRASLREKMLTSPLTDAPAFARAMEAAFRQMWIEYTRNVTYTQA